MQERTLVILLQVQAGHCHRYRGAQVQVQGLPEEDVREDTGGTVTGTEGHRYMYRADCYRYKGERSQVQECKCWALPEVYWGRCHPTVLCTIQYI